MESLTELRVRYAETDAMGIVHHGAYVVWLEAGRVELLRALGEDYRQWEARGVFLSVAEVRIAYRAPARFDDRILIRTRVQEAGRRKVVVGYRVEREGTPLAEGHTAHLVTGPEGRARVLPEDLRTLLQGGVREGHGPGQEGR